MVMTYGDILKDESSRSSRPRHLLVNDSGTKNVRHVRCVRLHPLRPSTVPRNDHVRDLMKYFEAFEEDDLPRRQRDDDLPKTTDPNGTTMT